MWMGLLIGRGFVLAGDLERACRLGFDLTGRYDPRKFAPGAPRQFAWQISLWARYHKARALADAGRHRKALSSLGAGFFARGESRGLPLGIQARILTAHCMGKRGAYFLAADEFNRAFREIEALRRRGGAEAEQAEALHRRASHDIAEMIATAVQAGVKLW